MSIAMIFLVPAFAILIANLTRSIVQSFAASFERAERERQEAQRAARKAAAEKAAAEKAAKAAEAKQAQQQRKAQAAQQAQPAQQQAQTAHQPAQNAQETAWPFIGNNMFRGETVSFTGTIAGCTRAVAIQAVQDNGGKAFHAMPSTTTLLVVGDKPGDEKMQRAERWGTRKITAQQFLAMLKMPLTLTPEEFAQIIPLVQ